MIKKLYASSKNFFAIFGGVLVLLQIYQFLTQARTSLRASFSTAEYRIPHKFDSLSSSASWKHFAFFLDSMAAAADGKLLHESSNKDSLIFPRDEFYEFYTNHVCLVQLQVQNTGDKEINNIKVHYGRQCTYEYTDNEGNLRSGDAKESFSIAGLRPSESLSVTIWTDAPYSELKLTHADGAVLADMAKTVDGTPGAIAEFFSHGPWLWILTGLTAYFLFLFIQFAYKKGLNAASRLGTSIK